MQVTMQYFAADFRSATWHIVSAELMETPMSVLRGRTPWHHAAETSLQ